MQMPGALSWFGRHAPQPEPPRDRPPGVDPSEATGGELNLIPEGPVPTWTPERIVVTDALWGEGYQFPGGEIETLRLARPLGLSAASSLLLIGAGGGGPACSVASQLGAWVSGFEVDPSLAASAVDRIARRNLTKRAQIETWDPEQPNFRPHFYHHGLALQPLNGSQPERTLAAIAGALKPNGHLMMTEIVANTPLDPANPTVAAWARLEHGDPKRLPTEVQITRTLGRLGFDVRVVEDVSERYMHQAMAGWRTVVRTMDDVRPTRREAMRSIQEAELWMIRLRLFQRGSLRLVRWHGIGGG
jgi:cyclopropane fatty-acyl-phospholipid synthase-like methyltransferase